MTTIPSGYIRSVFGAREPILDEVLRLALLRHRMPTIQIDDNAGRVLQLLTLLRRPRRVIEIGTLFGYSTIHIARGLPDDGRLTTIEIDPAAADLARRNLDFAGVGDRVDVVVGNAIDHLSSVRPKSVGMVFIDADKKSYPDYLKSSYPLLEPGGLLIADDAFSQGDFDAESDDGTGSRELEGIHTYNRAVGQSSRLFSAFLGTETGLLVSIKG